MNRLVLVPGIVVACYVAVASYTAAYIEHELDRPRVGFKIPTFVSTRGETQNALSSQQPSSIRVSYEVPNKPVAINAEPAAAVSPERPHQESMLVTVLLPARVHTGPSVDTPISNFYAVGTPLQATRDSNDWFEIIEPGTSKSGWIYRKYLGAISNSEQVKIASQEAQKQRPVAKVSVPVKRYAKAIPVKRYAKAFPVKRYAKALPAKRYAIANRFSEKSSRVKPVTPSPIRGRTEMASLLQRAFSGY
jgi:hypothetical protein